MFPASVQPGTVSLFSSTSSDPLALFSVHTDHSLSSDSIIHLLHDDSSRPHPPSPAIIIPPPMFHNREDSESNPSGYSLDQVVLQIQSPTLPTTCIRCPSVNTEHQRNADFTTTRRADLGIKHPWVHIQVRNMGREWSFEIGLVDQAGKLGVVRCSTFQKQPRLKIFPNASHPPILHLPFSFPPPSSRPLTAWSSITLHLPPLLSHFSSRSLSETADEGQSWSAFPTVSRSGLIPTGNYSHVAYVKIYATCRLRRIWFSEAGPGQRIPWEFELYAAVQHEGEEE